MTVNKVILVGNLGRDPEVRNTNTGNKVANLNLATSERRKGADGNWGDHTEWHRVVCFGNTADQVERFLKKGRQIYVEGKLSTRKYTDKDGVEKYSTEVVADVIRFLGGGGEGRGGRDEGEGGYGGGGYGGGCGGGGGGYGGGGGGGGGGYGGGSSGGGGGNYGGGGGADDDIPF